MRIAGAIVAEDTPYRQTIAAGRAAYDLLNEGVVAEKLHLSRKEQQWFGPVSYTHLDVYKRQLQRQGSLRAIHRGLVDGWKGSSR